MKILLVEDDDRIANPLAEALRHQNHGVEIARDGIEGWGYAMAAQYDLILLDLMLPRLDGITLCKRLRSAGSQALILMLTARDTTTDKVIGLDAGADDYLVKPFKLEELAARIQALSRRSGDAKPLIASPEASPVPDAAVFDCSSEVTCQRCQKQLKVQETDSGDLTKQEKSLYCPVCGNFLHSVRCSNLDVYVVKALQGKRVWSFGIS